jgi:hypothetical protein
MPDMKRPQYFGHLTNDLVWRRMAPGFLKGRPSLLKTNSV